MWLGRPTHVPRPLPPPPSRLKGAGQHVWEYPERQRQQQLHEGDDHEDGEGDQAEDVGRGARQLAALTARLRDW